MSETARVDDATALSDRELEARIAELEREERTVSRRRNNLHNRIDFVRTGGHASAEPSDESLEDLLATEHEVSERRHELHACIDQLRAERSRRR